MSESVSVQSQGLVSPLTDCLCGAIILSMQLLKSAILQQERGAEGPCGHSLARFSETDPLGASR